MKPEKSYLKSNIKKLKNSEIEIEVEVSFEQLNTHRKSVFKKISKNIEISGFRKGQVPDKMVIEKVGEMAILKEAAESVIGQAYSEIIDDSKIDAIGKPEVTITKLAPHNDLCFKIKTAVMPEIKLGNYIKTAKEVFPEENIIVTEKETEEVLNQIRTSQGETSTQDKNPKTEFPELNDKFAQSLGLKDLNDLKEKMTENIKQQKIQQAKGKKRMSLIEKIATDSVIDLPEILIESELQKMLAQFTDEVEKSGLNFDDYLKNAKTTIEKIREEWKPKAEKKAKIQLVLNKIAEEQKITADQKRLEAEVDLIIKQYPEANKESAKIFTETILKNEAVFDFLEKLST